MWEQFKDAFAEAWRGVSEVLAGFLAGLLVGVFVCAIGFVCVAVTWWIVWNFYAALVIIFGGKV